VSSKAKEAERKAALRKLELAMNVTDDLERRMGLTERWTSDSEEYRSAAAYLDNRQFIRAVDELEGLVVQRLFELSKAHLAGTGEYSTECLLQYTKRNACIGYKLRKHISKAIVRRSKAVRASLDRYNQLAPLQSPPCPVLEYSDVASYGWLGDFILLKMSRHGILKQPWAVSTNREIARKYFKVLRAKEEIYQLHIEIQRLQAWADDEEHQIHRCAEEMREEDPLLSAEIYLRYAEQSRVNCMHRARLRSIYLLPGYSGAIPTVSEKSAADDVDLDEQDIREVDDDQVNDEVARLNDCMDRIAM
jgi:hypothetical protein